MGDLHCLLFSHNWYELLTLATKPDDFSSNPRIHMVRVLTPKSCPLTIT